jgi:hypothetical protein
MLTGGASPGAKSESGSSEKFPPGTNSEGGDDSNPGDCSLNVDSSSVCAKVLFDRGIVVFPGERKRKRERTKKTASRAGLGLIVDCIPVSYLSTTYFFCIFTRSVLE